MSKNTVNRPVIRRPVPNGLSLAIISTLLISGAGWAPSASAITHAQMPPPSRPPAVHSGQWAPAAVQGRAPAAGAPASAFAGPTGQQADPASWRTDEFNQDWGLAAINADVAYARGLSGTAVRLGVFDTGTGLDHDEFAGKDHHSLRIGDLLADGTRCSNTRVISGPAACFASDGDVVSVDMVEFDASVPESVRQTIVADPRYLQPGASFQVHGTHVAGTIAANRDGAGMHGVAFGADLTVAKLFTDTARKWMLTPPTYSPVVVGSSWADQTAEQDMLAQMNADGVRALNHSWGLSYEPSDAQELDQLYAHPGNRAYLDIYAQGSRERGMIQVWAAGNSNGYNPSPEQAPIAGAYASLPRAFAEIEPYWLSVVNLDKSLSLSNLSHRCGHSANWCVAAPGTAIVSTIYGDDSALSGTIGIDGAGNVSLDLAQRVPTYRYDLMSGTSMAAPHVTGALGLLMERFPYLDNAQIRDVLLTTATDLGAPGVDDVYGWGLINLAKGVEGYGALRVDTDVVMDQAAGGAKVWAGAAWDDWTNDITGPGRLTKSGMGWLRLSGDNHFHGAWLREGTLELDGHNALSAAVEVQGGRLLVNGSLSATPVNQVAGLTHVSASGWLQASDIRVLGGALQLDGRVSDGTIQSTGAQFHVGSTGQLSAVQLGLEGGQATVEGHVADTQIDSRHAELFVGASARLLATQLNLQGGQAWLNGAFSTALINSQDSVLALGPTAQLAASQMHIVGGGVLIEGHFRDSQITSRDANLDVSAGAQLHGTDIRIDQGVLAFNGSQHGGHTHIGADALLKGAGRLGNTTVEGIIAPGNSIGTLTIDGDYVQSASATYQAELAPGSRSDRLNITGTASLAGQLVALPEPGTYYLGEQFSLLHAAGGVSGTFAAADFSAFSPFLAFDLVYQAGGARIEVARGQSLASAATTANQRAVAGAADVLAVDQGLPRPLTLLFPQQVGSALDGLSGELHAATPMLLSEASRHLRQVAGARMAGLGTASAGSSGAWAQVLSASDRLDGTANTAQIAADSTAVLFGAEHVRDAWALGALAGNGRSDITQRDGRAASSRVDTVHAGLYAGRAWQAFSLHGAVTYSRHDIHSTRQVDFAGFSDSLHGRHDARSRQAFLQAGYRFASGLEPFVQLAQVQVDTDPVNEQGGPAALRGKVDAADTRISTLGLRFDRDLLPAAAGEPGRVQVKGSVAYRQLHGERQPAASLGWEGGAAFAVKGSALDARGWLVELGLGARLSPRQQLDLGYSGQGGGNNRGHGYHARWSIRF